MTSKQALQKIIYVLRYAERSGSSKDEPEGFRTIEISDTLANEMANELESCLAELRGFRIT